MTKKTPDQHAAEFERMTAEFHAKQSGKLAKGSAEAKKHMADLRKRQK
jgi:hypothetical protein